MSEETAELHLEISEHFAAESATVADCLNRALEIDVTLSAGRITTWSDRTDDLLPKETGLCVTLGSEVATFLVLIPASLPLPDWFQDPNESQSSQMGTLAMEWSTCLLPLRYELEEFTTDVVANLATACEMRDAIEDTLIFEIKTSGESSLFLCGPFEKVPEPTIDEATSAPPHSVETSQTGGSGAQSPLVQNNGEVVDRARRILPLAVTISVRLAEKKIDLGQLMNIGPGTLLTFNKSCDDLLDLHVNNQLFCRGEAVKIGEKFGLKVNEIGIRQERESGVLTI